MKVYSNYIDYFDNIFKPLLQRDPTYRDRYFGFRKIFSYLIAKGQSSYTIIETGGIRDKGNWSDGQSSLLFYDFLKKFSGELTTIDVNPSVEVNYRTWLPTIGNVKVNVYILDGAVALSRVDEKVDLLYLDSFDIEHDNPEPSMQHHLKEFTNSKNIIEKSKNLLVAVDDNFGKYGKGRYVLDWAIKNEKEILHDGYQVIFKV